MSSINRASTQLVTAWRARNLPETALHVTSRRPTTRPSAAPVTCSVAWVDEAAHGDLNHPHINGMQGVRGSNPLSSTPGQWPSSASTAPDSPASGSRWAAIYVARPIPSSDAAGCCRCRRRGSPGPAGGSVVSRGFAACCGRTVCPSVWPGPKISYPATARIWPRPAAPVPPSRQASVTTCSSP